MSSPSFVLSLGVGILSGVIPSAVIAQRPKPRPVPAVQVPVPPTASQGVAEVAGCAPSVRTWWRDVAGIGKYGRIVCAADPTRPAILLFHGNHEDGRTWTAPSYTEYAYDYRHHPGEKRIGDTHSMPNAGVYKIGASRWLYGKDRAAWDKAKNWFDFLVNQGFTVATWSQDMLTVEDAIPSAREAFDSFLTHTAARSPSAPPPVALIAHSRGGLLVRQVLKEKGSMNRVKWVVTLHTPHTGSELGRAPGLVVAEVLDLMDCCAPAGLKEQLRKVVVEMMRPATTLCVGSLWCWNDEDRELQPNSPLFRNLAEGEKRLDDVTYYTFGGTNPRVYRLYTWMFDAQSAVPQFSASRGKYYIWRVKPVEIASVSPILDKIRDFVPEVTPGKGDALVSDASSRLPWSIHTTTALNHAEVLWDKPLMRKVAGLIDGPLAAAPGRGESRTVRTEVVPPRMTR